MPNVTHLEFIRSQYRNARNPEIIWCLLYTGTLYFSDGGAHSSLYDPLMFPAPPPPRQHCTRMFSVVAAGRIKPPPDDRIDYMVITWESKFFGVETPEEWRPALEVILRERVIPQALA